MGFDQNRILAEMEKLRRPSGAFIAAPSEDYSSMWLRDMLYITFAYSFIGEYEKAKQGMWVIFDVFRRFKKKIKMRIASPTDIYGGVIHAKYHADTLAEITTDEGWAHHQLDALGLFLYVVANLDYKNIPVIRGEEDLSVLELLVYYLRSVEYWQRPDYGMWEECLIRHSSSIGAVAAGLTAVKQQRLAEEIPEPLIEAGREALRSILPCESREYTSEKCQRDNHKDEQSHDCDAAQLSLIWPYHLIVNPAKIRELISRIIDGHQTENGKYHCLVQKRGLNRYWGDNFERSDKEGGFISAEWPMFFFWISIIYSQLHESKEAFRWFMRGSTQIINNEIPEAYRNQKPNRHTPLAWAHAIALIAWSKLPEEWRIKVNESPHPSG